MGDLSNMRQSLAQGARLLTAHEHPSRPENHSVIDPTKWDFYAMDCYRIVGEDKRVGHGSQEEGFSLWTCPVPST
jgi:hypothetical protein